MTHYLDLQDIYFHFYKYLCISCDRKTTSLICCLLEIHLATSQEALKWTVTPVSVINSFHP